MKEMVLFMDAREEGIAEGIAEGRAEERKKTEAERKRADAECKRADDAEAIVAKYKAKYGVLA